MNSFGTPAPLEGDIMPLPSEDGESNDDVSDSDYD